MSQSTVEAIAKWQNNPGEQESLEVTFHGGEPLVPGAKFYRMALPTLREKISSRKVRYAMQSNLWLLTDELCDLFREFNVSLGTSLDGPEDINDAQRGKGYFQRTMVGIELARAHGLDVGCICTFTAQSLPHLNDIFDFFVREGLNFTIHAALPSIRYDMPHPWTLSPEQHGNLLVDMLDRYLANTHRVRISTFDSLCRSICAGQGGICTFGDCLGGYLAVGPNGSIYPCQRFAGIPRYRMANVHDCPSPEVMEATPVWRAFRAREEQIEEACSGCEALKFCRGGCPYNVLAASDGSFNGKLRDPHCEVYRRIFNVITDRAVQEVFSEENITEVVRQPDQDKGLLRRGKLLSIMRGGPHPYETTQHARRIVAAVVLAATGGPEEAARKFQALGLVTDAKGTRRAMQVMDQQLTARSSGLNNLYLHVTFTCPLRCQHCYANAGTPRQGAFSVEDTVRACREAAAMGFRHAVITGGEPLVHPNRDKLLDALAGLRQEVKPLLTVLRTSLARRVDHDLLWRIGHSTDEMVVSVDGDRETHDARRGIGSYDLIVGNLRALAAMGYDTDLSLAAVLPLEQANGAPGESVRHLAKELGIRRTRFRPLLPLGRAIESDLDILPETLWGHIHPREMVAYGFNPVASCGIGQNLYVEPDGAAYPCYAWHSEQWRLGWINQPGGLRALVQSNAFTNLGSHTVNTNRACRRCSLRYLCGGACRAWNRQAAQMQTDLDAPPADCSLLHRRSQSLLLSAMEHLQISKEQWMANELPLPNEVSKKVCADD